MVHDTTMSFDSTPVHVPGGVSLVLLPCHLAPAHLSFRPSLRRQGPLLRTSALLIDAVAVACECGVPCLRRAQKTLATRRPWHECSHSLSQVFAEFGSITEANVVYDRETGRSRGFGFVAYTEEAAASSAIKVCFISLLKVDVLNGCRCWLCYLVLGLGCFTRS